MHPCPGKVVALSFAVVYNAQAVHALMQELGVSTVPVLFRILTVGDQTSLDRDSTRDLCGRRRR